MTPGMILYTILVFSLAFAALGFFFYGIRNR